MPCFSGDYPRESQWNKGIVVDWIITSILWQMERMIYRHSRRRHHETMATMGTTANVCEMASRRSRVLMLSGHADAIVHSWARMTGAVTWHFPSANGFRQERPTWYRRGHDRRRCQQTNPSPLMSSRHRRQCQRMTNGEALRMPLDIMAVIARQRRR